jgi:hypothetical protein
MSGDRRKRIWLAYVASMALALYTHYFAAFAWAAINVGVIADLIIDPHPSPLPDGQPSRRCADTGRERERAQSLSGTWSSEGRLRFLGFWVLAQFIILACFLPWIPNALAQAGSNATYFPGRVTWNTVVADTWRAFSVGEWGDMSLVGWLWFALILLGGLGSLVEISHRGTAAWGKTINKTLCLRVSVAIFCLALIIVPLLLMSGLAWLKPKFAPRYLLPSLPAFSVLASIGISILIDGMQTRYCRWASIGVAIALALPLASIGSVLHLYTDPALARPDVRSVARYIEAAELPSDAILLVGGHQAPAFNHYYNGQATVIPLPSDLLPAAQSPLDARALAQLEAIVQAHPRAWLVLWQNQISDPTNIVEDTLVAEGKRINVGAGFHEMGVLLFDVNGARIPDAPQYEVNATFSELVRAVGYNVDSRRISIDTPLRFGLYLEATGPITGNYQIFTHLVAADGTLIAQADHIAGADSYPTSLWQPGNLLYNRFEIQLPAGTPPGEYRVLAGLYDERGRLKLSDGRDHFELFDVTVTP